MLRYHLEIGSSRKSQVERAWLCWVRRMSPRALRMSNMLRIPTVRQGGRLQRRFSEARLMRAARGSGNRPARLELILAQRPTAPC